MYDIVHIVQPRFGAAEGTHLENAMLRRRPLYLQVCDLLTARITTGEWKPGTYLPNENDVARELGVSAGTARKALKALEERRLIVRRQGRGTFVADQASQEIVGRFERLF